MTASQNAKESGRERRMIDGLVCVVLGMMFGFVAGFIIGGLMAK